MREVVRQVQSARKAAGLNVDDRINLVLESDDASLRAATKAFATTICAETLAESIGEVSATGAYSCEVRVEGMLLRIFLSKV